MRPISGLDVIEQQGFEKGKRDGIAENTLLVVTNMLKKNFSYQIIAEIAETSVENVSRIAEENNLGYK